MENHVTQHAVRRKFLLSAATGFAMAIIMGYPMTGWLLETGAPRNEPRVHTPAFRLAKAGVDRGLWQINKEKAALDAVLKGREIAGLEGETAYSDVPGGTYKVEVAYDPAKQQFRIVGQGVDAKTGEKRALELLLKQQPDAAGLMQTEWREVQTES